MAYRIGSFNMCKFSFQSNAEVKIKKDIAKICEIIEDNFDIVAIQEILSKDTLNYRLLRNLNPSWKGKWDQPKASTTNAAEGYAFLWNTKRFKLMTKRNRYGIEEVIEPVIIDNYHVGPGQQRLLRDPYYARFIPVNGPFFELRLFNTHIRYSAGSGGENEEEEIEDIGTIMARRQELDILIKSVCDRFGDKRYGDNRAVYAFLLGDYNLNIRNGINPSPYLLPDRVEIVDGRTRKCYRTVQEEKTTLKRPDKVDETTIDKFANNYDHFTYDEERLVNTLGIGLDAFRIDTLSAEWCGGDVLQHRIKISDHVPVSLVIDINGR